MKTIRTLLIAAAVLLPIAAAQTLQDSPVARDAAMVQELLPLIQAQASREGKPDLRPVHLWQDEDGGGMLRCVDMAAEVSPATLSMGDYELRLRPRLAVHPATEYDEDKEDDDVNKPEIRHVACLARLQDCYQELPAVLKLMKHSREIPQELVDESQDSFSGGLAGKAFLKELGLVAVNDPQKPWRWGATFYLPYEDGGGYNPCPFILEDGKWVRSPVYLCFYFASNCLRDNDFIGKSRINCLYPPELSDKGKELCGEYARHQREEEALLAQRAELLRAVQNRASADAVIGALKRSFRAEQELRERRRAVHDIFFPDEDEDGQSTPWYKELTRDEFAPENFLHGEYLLRLLGLEWNNAPFDACQDEQERLMDARFYGSEALKALLEPKLHWED